MTHCPAQAGRAGDPLLPWLIGGSLIICYGELSWAVVGEHVATLRTMLHLAGTGFLLAGVLLAAKGISDVRREWTGAPGTTGTLSRWLTSARQLVASGIRYAVDGIAALLGRPAIPSGIIGSGGLVLPKMRVSASADNIWASPAPGSTVGERLEWLEAHMLTAGRLLKALEIAVQDERKERLAAAHGEAEARSAEDQLIYRQIADLAGGACGCRRGALPACWRERC
jgi:hypothetical protein